MPHTWRRSFALLPVLAAIGVGLEPAGAQVTQTYLFRDSLAPSEGAGNVLVPVYNGTGTILTGGTGFVGGSFVTETISATACPTTPAVRAWSFPKEGGLRSDNATPTVVTGSYSLSMLMRYDPMSGGYARLVDFSNSTLDTGIYELGGEVSFYPVGVFASGSFVSGQDVFVTITRDAGTQLVSLYIDGVAAGTYSDVGNLYAPAATVVYFLMDNTTGAANIRESDPGTIAYLQVRDTPMTTAEVAASLSAICGAVAATTTTTTTTTLPPCGNGVVDAGEQCDDGARNGSPTSCCSARCTAVAGPACSAMMTAPAAITIPSRRLGTAPVVIPLTITLPVAPTKGSVVLFQADGFAEQAAPATAAAPPGAVEVTKSIHRTFRGRRRKRNVKLPLNALGKQLLRHNGSLSVTVQQQLTEKSQESGQSGQSLVNQITTRMQTR